MAQRKTVSFTKNAANVFFHILTGCNLRCRHCYINPDQHGTNILPIETVRDWLSIFVKQTAAANVIFLGGEPTLHPELPDAVQAAKNLGYQSVTIDTNGFLFHDILDRVTPDEVDYFSFSLDGATRETNDRIRGDGVYDICLANIRKTKHRGFRTSLIYTVSSDNIHELAKVVPLLADLGIDRFFIQVIGIRGNSAQDDRQLQVDRQTWQGMIPRVAEQVAENGTIVTYPKVFLETDEPFECAGLCSDNYFIFPNGRVYRCPLCEDFPIHAMEIREGRLIHRPKITETDFFGLNISEGCVMNKLIQPDNLSYSSDGTPMYKVACCMLKEEVREE